MDFKKICMPRLLPALLALGVAGCYQYQPPAEVFEGTDEVLVDAERGHAIVFMVDTGIDFAGNDTGAEGVA